MIARRALLAAASAAGFTLALRPREADADDAGARDEGTFLRHTGAPHHNLATPLAYFDRLLTPTAVFFVRSHFGAPSVDRTRKLHVAGLVEKPLALSVDELRAAGLQEVTVTAVLQCAGNGRALHRPRVPGVQWVHGAMGQATFTGVRLKDLLAKAGIGKDARFLRVAGADAPPKPTVPAFVRSLPVERALDPTTIVAWKMNGEELSHAHGGPLRLVVPGWAGDHWVKWLTQLRAEKEEDTGFFMKTAYRMPTEPIAPGAAVPPEKMAPATTFPVKSVVARPEAGTKRPVGPQEVVGLAFSGVAPIASVEVSIDDGKTFAPAKLEGEAGVGRAQVFRFAFDAKTPGPVTVLVRAKDKKGNVQPRDPAWNPSGYFWNGWHAVTWEVTS